MTTTISNDLRFGRGAMAYFGMPATYSKSLRKKYLPGRRLKPLSQRTIPRLAKDPVALRAIQRAIREVPTQHRLLVADARPMTQVPDERVHLVLTSPPYFDLKKYPDHESPVGPRSRLRDFHQGTGPGLGTMSPGTCQGRASDCYRRGRCRSRREHGEHHVIPLHASIAETCRELGFNNLATMIWHKISNARFEVENGTSFLGKPYEPNAVIKNDVEFILMQRKSGGYRQPSEAMGVSKP